MIINLILWCAKKSKLINRFLDRLSFEKDRRDIIKKRLQERLLVITHCQNDLQAFKLKGKK